MRLLDALLSIPRVLLLIAREAGVPGEQGGGGRWAVDDLFLDQDAIPTLVEVKRSSDTRIRREVVGQMLDYAANAVVYWPVDHLYTQFETQCRARNLDPDQELAAFLGPDADPTTWQRAKTNCRLDACGWSCRRCHSSELPYHRVPQSADGPAEILA
jgi:hypothetical protein